ncbi:MAG TPA: 30S ribosome-binding factor RbfA [Polyangiaceae bacterium]
MKEDTRRIERVAGLLRHHLTDALHRDVGDPELLSLVVTSVDVSRDLSVAHIRVRRLSTTDSAEARKSVLARLKRVTPRLRRALGPRMEIRKLPELRFVYDTGEDARGRVEELLQEIAAEKKDPQG